MNLSTIEMPRAKAREAFLDYRRAVRERHSAEDAQIMRAYRELAKGTALIKLPVVIRAGGTTTITTRRWDGQPGDVVVPRLAVARAHRSACWTFGVDRDGDVELRGRRDLAPSNRKDRIVVGGFDEAVADPGWRPRILAQAPVIPPPFRPAHKLEGYHLLWEAEWALDPVPPTDPALLKHVGGDLYAVVAVWDLTEVERAVLAGRAVE
jgi:hypothetical protein